MTTMKSILAGVFLLGCVISTPAEAGRLFLVGVDESGSYDLRDQCLAMLERLILKEMQPGDVLVGRRITDKSYLDTPKTMLLPRPLVIPEAVPQKKNTLDLRAKRQAESEESQRLLVRLQAIKHIRGLQPVNAPKTDIFGFFAVCNDHLANLEPGMQPIILIASDMIDNQRLNSSVNLHGAMIIIIAFQKDYDPKRTQQTRDQWAKTLRAMHAGEVHFLGSDHDIPKILVQAQPRHAQR